jgi:glycosyltransferase involved in cell wall biosynthesis
MAYSFVSIFMGVLKTDLTYAVFADLRAFFAVICCRLLKKKLIVQVGGYESAAIQEINYGGLLKRGQAKRFRYILRKADLILTYSDFSRQEVLAVAKVSKIIALHLGIKQIQVPSSSSRILVATIGNATESKWKLKGLDTFAATSAAFPEIRFVIVGEFDRAVKHKLLEIDPQLEFTGYLDSEEVKSILLETKVYCQLSRRESFGMALLEAMQCGAVPVVTKTGSLPEVAGEVGFYTEYGNTALTIEAIKQAWQSGFAEKARTRAEEKFSLQVREEKLIELIRKL